MYLFVLKRRVSSYPRACLLIDPGNPGDRNVNGAIITALVSEDDASAFIGQAPAIERQFMPRDGRAIQIDAG